MPSCSKCGLLNPETARFCQSCGAPLPAQVGIPAYGAVPSVTAPGGLTDSQKRAASIWAGIFTVGVLVAIDRAETALAYSDVSTAIETLVGSAISFVIFYFAIRWLLERFFRNSLT